VSYENKTFYFTHCCAKKDESLKGLGKKVSPMQLYRATPTQRFMKRCIETDVDWAIFSDKYGFVFPQDRIQWYEKHPKTVIATEKKRLFDEAYLVLEKYDTAFFYYNPGRIHPLYQDLVEEMRKRNVNIRQITHLLEIF
jgi:hypothetical protein